MLTFGNKGKGFSLQSHSPFKNLLPFSKPRSISEMGSMRIKRHLCSNKHFFFLFDKEGNAIMTHKLRNATIQLPILDTKIRKWDFLSFLPKFPTASSCFFTRSGMNFFAQKMNFTVFYLVRKWIYPKKQWNFQKTGKFIFWKMNFTVFSGKFIFWLNKNG